MPSFPSKRKLKQEHLDQFQAWIKHHQCPLDQRILDEFEQFFDKEWLLHRQQLEKDPRLTHRLVKHIISIIPKNYIIHNEDHANAHPYDLLSQHLQPGGVQHLDGFKDLPHARQKRPGHQG